MIVVPLQLNNLPIEIHCVAQLSAVSFQKSPWFQPFIDLDREGVYGEFHHDGFSLYDNEQRQDIYYQTLYEYKKLPVLLKWLQQLQLESPVKGG